MNERPENRLHDVMKEFRTAMLVTHDAGRLFARPLTVAEVDDDEIWFSTSVDSPKVSQIEDCPEVLVTMQSASRFVTVGGTCEISRDRAQLDRLWSESWKIWFPRGKDDPTLVLLRVRVETGEYWDVGGTNRLKFLWQAAKAYFTGEKVEQDPAGDHARL